MDQVSRPILIALAAVIGLAGMWFAVLRPNTDAAAPAPAPAAIGSLKNTPSVAEATPKPAAGTKASTPKTPKIAATAGTDRSKPILAELAKGKTAVLLFWNPRAADDRAVRRELAGIDRHSGRVTVHSAAVGAVGAYNAITEGVEVLQSPTILVIGRDHRARTIVGFTDTKSIDQLVGDVRHKARAAN